MDLIKLLTLAIMQGLTEFLPISSSAHLILLPRFFGWEDQGLAFDVAVHVGTLAAVLLYFRQTVGEVGRDFFLSLYRRQQVGESRLAWAVVIGTIPVVLAGLLFGDLAEGPLREPWVLAWATIGFGVLLGVADRHGGGGRSENGLTLRDAVIIGLAQALAIIPGTSRSGITITAGLFLGMSRTAAARFSFFLSIPTIALAGGWKALELAQTGVDQWAVLFWGALIAGVSAYLCIAAFLALLERMGMMPFVIYRLVLGVVLLAVF